MSNSWFIDYKEREQKAGNNGRIEWKEYDIFDRVINVKLTTGVPKGEGGIIQKMDTYVIRSDYEMYNPKIWDRVADGTLSTSSGWAVRKCVHKPSIKVQYKQVAEGTAIQIDIFISNFFMLTKDGRTLLQFNADDYPLQEVEVQMGYFGQFSKPFREADRLPTLAELYEMKAPEHVQTLICTVEYVQTDKLPPDSTLHIHGFVANSYGSSIGKIKQKEINFFPPVLDDNKQMNNIAHWAYNNITRRFLRTSALNKDVTLYIDNGYMQFSDAEVYGIHVFISHGVITSSDLIGLQYQKNSAGAYVSTAFFGNAPRCDTAVKTLNSLKMLLGSNYCFKMLLNGDYIIYTKEESRNAHGLTLSKWYTYDPYLKKSARVDIPQEEYAKVPKWVWDKALLNLVEHSWTEIMALTKSATPDGKLDLRVEGAQETAKANLVAFERLKSDMLEKNILPAVYNITTDALCTIVCPFFMFINPFDTVYFSSRYSLGGLVSYYANFGASENEFTILWQDVSFATVEDVNECTMVATGRKS